MRAVDSRRLHRLAVSLQYHFVLGDGAGRARLWPGLDAAGPEPRLANRPYYVVRPSG